MPLKIEDFDPVSNGDLREFWKMNRDPNLRRLILEMVRHRRVIYRALGEAQRIEDGLREKNDGNIVGASGSLVSRLRDEQTRLGSEGGNVIKSTTDDQYSRP
jgi:hypothetical protein